MKNFVNFVKILCKNCHYVSFIDISKTIYQHIKIDISKYQQPLYIVSNTTLHYHISAHTNQYHLQKYP